MLINGKETSLNLADVNINKLVMEKMTVFEKDFAELQKKPDQTLDEICDLLYGFFDSVVGKDTRERLFDGGKDVVVALDSYYEVVAAVNEVTTSVMRTRAEFLRKQKSALMERKKLQEETDVLTDEIEKGRIEEFEKMAEEEAKVMAEQAELAKIQDLAAKKDTSIPFSDMSQRERIPLPLESSDE